MERKSIEVGSFAVNCSIVAVVDETYIIDPGQEPEAIIAALGDRMPTAILLTHGHFDHINALPALKEKWPALEIVVTAADAEVMAHPMNRMPPEYDSVKVGDFTEPSAFAKDRAFEILSTPGHTPGGVCYYFPEDDIIFTGDTLFAGSVGRTDLPGGDMATLMASLGKLKKLPRKTRVVPGHGPETTIGEELDGNMFLQ